MRVIYPALICCLFLYTSCQKDNADPVINNNGPLLKTYVQMTEGTLPDIKWQMDFTYDSRQRVATQMKKTNIYTLGPHWLIDTYDSAIFYYTTNAVLPYQIQHLYYNVSRTKIAEKNIYYTYNDTGLLIKDSSYLQGSGNFENCVIEYKYRLNTSTIITKMFNYNGAISKDSMHTKLIPCGENLCKQYDTAFMVGNIPVNYARRDIVISVDNTLNPFYGAKMKLPAWGIESRLRRFEEAFGFYKNNISFIDYFSDQNIGNQYYTCTYTYTWNAENAPTKCTEVYIERLNPSSYYRTDSYYYYY